jgi:hypothetical protein
MIFKYSKILINQVKEDFRISRKPTILIADPDSFGRGVKTTALGMNAANNGTDNITQFNALYLQLIETEGNNHIRQIASEALALARTMGHLYLEINVLCAAANGYTSGGQLAIALKIYDEATNIARQGQAKAQVNQNTQDNDLYEQLEVQVLFYKGVALLKSAPPQYNAAYEVYQQIDKKLSQIIAYKGNLQKVDWTNGGVLHFYRFEALRLSGFCQEQLGRSQSALPHYANAFSIAEKTTTELRQAMPLNTVGKAMMDIYRKTGMKLEFFKVKEKLDALTAA